MISITKGLKKNIPKFREEIEEEFSEYSPKKLKKKIKHEWNEFKDEHGIRNNKHRR